MKAMVFDYELPSDLAGEMRELEVLTKFFSFRFDSSTSIRTMILDLLPAHATANRIARWVCTGRH